MVVGIMVPLHFYTLFYAYVFVMPISSTLSVQRVYSGDTITLICPVRKEKSPIQWEKYLVTYSQDSNINPKLDERIRIRSHIVGNHRDGYFDLQIMNTTHEDEGIYTCTTNINGTGVSKNTHLIIIDRFSPCEINCTLDITITDSFTTTDQMDKGNHQENTLGITRTEIILCCALVFMFLLTIFLYSRNRHYTIRNTSISDHQQSNHAPTSQEPSLVENIHLYSTADDTSVHLAPISRNSSMQGDGNVLESNSSISSSRGYNVEEDYIHPYDILVYNSQDNNHEYEKLDHSGEYFTSRTHDGNGDEKFVTNTEIISSSITPESVQIGHDNTVESSSLKGETKDNHEGIANIHITGTNANTKNINESSNCVQHHTIHDLDDISLD